MLFPVSNHVLLTFFLTHGELVTAGGTCATTCPSFVDVAGALEFCGGRSQSDFKARDRKCRFERTD
jgi:hypothetical protein